MPERVIQKHLESGREWFPILQLQGIVLGPGAVICKEEVPLKILVWLIRGLLSEQALADLADIRCRHALFAWQRLLYGRIPLVGARQPHSGVKSKNVKRKRRREGDHRQILGDIWYRYLHACDISWSDVGIKRSQLCC